MARTDLPPLVTASQLGTLLHSARKTQRVSQTDLAIRLGISQSRVSHLELNSGQLSVDQLMAWCAALGLELTLGSRGVVDQAAPDNGEPVW